jgi:hypothetical protein
MSLDLPVLSNGELVATVKLDATTVHVGLDGKADTDSLNGLHDLLEKLHAEALRLRVTEVVFDFQRLAFMSSSGVKAFVNLIMRAQGTQAEQRYRLRFRSNPDLRWQKRSLHALTCFAPELITVE